MKIYPLFSGQWIWHPAVSIFLSSTLRKTGGKSHHYLAAVEKRRLTSGRVAQRTTLYLGAIKDQQPEAWCKSIEVFDEARGESHEINLFPATLRCPSLLMEDSKMATRRAEFHFAVQGLLVRSELLDTKLEFRRGNFLVQIRFPGQRTNWDREIPRNVHVFCKHGTFGQAFAVWSIKLIVYGEGPRGEDTEGSIEHLRASFRIAEAVATDLIEWARIHGQPWLGLHGQPVRRIGHHLLGDESDDMADYSYSQDVLPTIEDWEPEYELEASLDAASTTSLAGWLGGNPAPLPIAETLLADALYFIGLSPPDYQRSVLVAAIACEVKVKATLRQRVPADRLPLVDLLLENPRDWSVAAIALFDKAIGAALGRSLKSVDSKMYKDLGKLFELRNRIAHQGEKPEESEARRVVLAARQVFRWLDAS